MQSLTAALVEDFKAWRAMTPLNRNGHPVEAGAEADASGAAPKTLQFEVQTVGTFFKHALRLKLVTENPVSDVQPIRVRETVPVYLEEPEIAALLAAAQTFDQWARPGRTLGLLLHDIFITYLKTGMRLEELRNLEWSDVDLAREEISIRSSKEVKSHRNVPLSAESIESLRKLGRSGFDALDTKSRQKLLPNCRMSVQVLVRLEFENFDLQRGILIHNTAATWSPKSTRRSIPIAPGLRLIFERQPRTDNLVFCDPVTGGLWRYKINRLVQRCAAQAGIKKSIHTHSLRHTFATQLRQRGVALETIKELLGHADIRDTLIYAHFSPTEAKAAIPKIDFF